MIPYIEDILKERFLIKPISILLPCKQIRDQNLGIISVQINDVSEKKENPKFIVKFPRFYSNEFANKTIELEFQNLLRLQEKFNGQKILDTIPKPVFYENINSCKVLGESFLLGEEMASFIFSEVNVLTQFKKNLIIAIDWLIQFQTTLGYKKLALSSYMLNFINILSTFEETQKNIIKLDKLQKYLDINNDFLIYPQHGDFHASNIFLTGNNISGITDWEDFSIENLPPCFDFIHFVFTYLEALFDSFAAMNRLDIVNQLQTNADFADFIFDIYKTYCSKLSLDSHLLDLYTFLYLFNSFLFAVDKRKEAKAAANKYKMLMLFSPNNFKELLYCLPIKNYFQSKNIFAKCGNKSLEEFCENKINDIKKYFFESKQQT